MAIGSAGVEDSCCPHGMRGSPGYQLGIRAAKTPDPDTIGPLIDSESPAIHRPAPAVAALSARTGPNFLPNKPGFPTALARTGLGFLPNWPGIPTAMFALWPHLGRAARRGQRNANWPGIPTERARLSYSTSPGVPPNWPGIPTELARNTYRFGCSRTTAADKLSHGFRTSPGFLPIEPETPTEVTRDTYRTGPGFLLSTSAQT
jgi:hypothetical protein